MTVKSLAVPAVAVALAAAAAPAAQARPHLTPISVTPLAPPVMPVVATDGRRHLAYELTLENFAQAPVTVDSIAVRSGHGRRLLAVAGAQVTSVMRNFAKDQASTLGPTEGGRVRLDVTLPRKARVPRMLVHRVVATVALPDGTTRRFRFDSARTRVSRQSPEVVGAPLRGGLYMDFNGCCGDSPHRRALEPLDGTPYLSERFAADLIQVDEHGVGGAGDFSRNESLFTYGEPVLAVANAKVVETVRSVKDNVPFFEPPASAFTERTIVGNRVILRLRDGRYAAYGHLKPGSIRVRRGDRVRAGQVIAQVGNTGQSGGAHLHFQVSDGPDPIASNGLPFVFRSFRVVGHAPNIDEFLTGQAPADIRRDGRTGPMHRVMPLMEAVVRFAGH